jgi:tRNA(Ile)-lysidine synthase
MDIPLPDGALAERFAADLAACAGGMPGRLAIAVSGGPDSLGLLLLAAAALGPARIAAATVDHGLRSEAADEARAVAGICARMGVAHRTLSGNARRAGAGLQAAARALRYDLLGRWADAEGADALATAHHIDDQAETLLMRLARGAGAGGLSGIRPARPIAGARVQLVRPLLGWRREEFGALVAAAGLEAADDPANRDPAFDRTRARRLLAETDWLEPARLAAAAAHLADADAALAFAADALWAERAREEESGALLLDLAGLPSELARRLAVRAIDAARARAGLAGPWRQDRLAAALAPGPPRTLAGLLLAFDGALLRLGPAPARTEPR